MKHLCICDPRSNCIVGGFLLLIYYSAVSTLMFCEIHYSEITIHKSEEGEFSYVNNIVGFLVLGICFTAMALDSLLLIFGSIMRKIPFLILFLVIQFAPISVEFFYLLVALMFGIETESILIYLLPFIYVIYVDVVSCFYFRELRREEKRVSEALDMEY